MRYALGLMLFVACARPDIDPAPYDERHDDLLERRAVQRLCNGDTHSVSDSGPPVGFCFLGT